MKDADQLSNTYAAAHPLVVVEGYTHPQFCYPREMYASLHLELVKITHLSQTTGRRLRGAGILRTSDFQKQIVCKPTERPAILAHSIQEAEEVTCTYIHSH